MIATRSLSKAGLRLRKLRKRANIMLLLLSKRAETVVRKRRLVTGVASRPFVLLSGKVRLARDAQLLSERKKKRRTRSVTLSFTCLLPLWL